MENDRNYPLRRQSDFKPKVTKKSLKKLPVDIKQMQNLSQVSKWTKVKAAFKWEKTNALPLAESKSSDSVLSPNNSELAR